MNRTLFVTALLAALTAALHTFVGTAEIETPLMQSSLPREVALLLYAGWHLVSVALTLSAVSFFAAARSKNASLRSMVTMVSSMWLGFGAVFIVVDLAYAGPAMLLALPQWVLLLPVGVLGLWGNARAASAVAH
ncbi:MULTISPECIES: hypothetical protein [unclassified Janthinobacterium]|uniref:hypothetical protein n=1 Tax=unclassified Janthinobacterium TaxID=2610881 RepID=UPI0004760629|nr:MULTISPECIES: hypothetical protein [unclassified Janthinobacterium]MEC5162382.1 putative membrane protein [Janthinobacterium sp. CG_S6]